MATWKDSLVLKFTNIIVYIAFLGINVYGPLAPHPHHKNAATHESYLTPAPWFVYTIWSLIHLLLLGLMVFQFFPRGYSLFIEGIGWRFPALGIFNALYATFATATSKEASVRLVYATLSFVSIVLATGVISHIYHTLRVTHKPEKVTDTLLVHVPFSLFHGLSVVLVLVAAFSSFGVDANKTSAGVATQILVVIALLLLETTAAAYVVFRSEDDHPHSRGDITGAVVIALSLWAIFQRQTAKHAGPVIHYAALLFSIISLVAVLRAVINTIQARSRRGVALTDEERAPLVG